ncbi:oxidoreductase, partial [Kribbella sp. NPDC055110]
MLTSIRAARRRIRYESWHLLHLYAYLGVGIALPHQLWTGQEFLASTGRIVFWWTLWAVAAAAVLVYRIGVPIWRNARHRLRVTAVVPETEGVVSV